MADPQTWSLVFGSIAQVYGVLLGLFAIMITFGINLAMKIFPKNVTTPESRSTFLAFRTFSRLILVSVGAFLVISVVMLALGSSVEYNTILLWGAGIIPFTIIVSGLLYLVIGLIKAITEGLAGVTKPNKKD